MRIVIHAGFYKTGTSFLQSLAFRLRDSLARQGVFVPEGLSRKNFGGLRDKANRAHHLLFHRLNTGADDDEAWAALATDVAAILREAESRDCHTILFSSELIADLKPDGFARLQQLFAGHEIHVVFCVRNINLWYESYWNQIAKSVSVIPDVVHNKFRRGLRFVETAGVKADFLLAFHPDATAYAQRFFRICGAEVSDTEIERMSRQMGNKNESISYEAFFLLRQHRRGLDPKTDRKKVLNLIESVIAFQATQDFAPLVLVSPETHAQIHQELAPTRAAIAARLADAAEVPPFVMAPDELVATGRLRDAPRNVDFPPDPDRLAAIDGKFREFLRRTQGWRGVLRRSLGKG